METVTIDLKAVLYSSCKRTHPFFRKMFEKYGKDKKIKLTEKKYYNIYNEFEKYYKTVKTSPEMAGIPIEVHIWCFIDTLIDLDVSPKYWQKVEYYGDTNKILKAGWRVIKKYQNT